jgi:hypothetical protein
MRALETTQGDRLELWDTPGFGDSASAAPAGVELESARLAAVPVGITADRAFFSSQQAVRNVHHAHVVLYPSMRPRMPPRQPT